MAKQKSSGSRISRNNNSNTSKIQTEIVQQTIEKIKQSVEPILSVQRVSLSILDVLISIFKIIDSLLMALSYFLLVFQTIYILNSKQPKYINLRHIALKWLACGFFYLVKSGFSSNNDVNSQLITILLDFFIILVAYPSNILKTMHLKSFSQKEQQRYNNAAVDPHTYDITFSTKIIISLVVILLNFCKHLIAFVTPNHRRPIEDALRAINTVLIDRKCFWSIYNEGNQQNTMYEKDKAAIKEYLTAGSKIQTPKNLAQNNITITPTNHPHPYQSLPLRQEKNVIKAYGQKCSSITTNGFKPIKRVSIKYSILQSKLELLDLDFGKSQSYILEQLTEKSENVLQFIVLAPGQKHSQPIYIKFKSVRQLEHFMRSIEESQKAF